MTTTFFEYILNPFYIIYYFIWGNDFISNGKRNLAYFIINLTISLILTFGGTVYNELIILFCCRLEHDTYNQITRRSRDESEYSILADDEDDLESDT